MAKRPSAVKMPRSTTPSCLPEATRTFPVRRSAKRTEPSAPPSSSVRPSGLSCRVLVADRDAAQHPQRAGVADDGLALRGVGRHERAAVAGGHEACEAVAVVTDRAEPAAGPPVEPQHERPAAGGSTTDGVERAPVGREAQAGDQAAEAVAADLQMREDPMGRGVEDDRLAGADRDPRPVRAVVQLVEANERVDDAACVAGQGHRRRRHPPRPRIDEAQRAVALHEGQRPAVGAEVEVDEPVAVAAHHADRRRALQQSRQKVGARLHRVVERDALAGEQQRPIQVVVGQRLRAEPLGVRGHRLVVRVAALVERDRARDRPPRPAARRRPPGPSAGGGGRARSRPRSASRKVRSRAVSSGSWSAAQSRAAARRAPR